jgi:Ala-tRNA(Pro) deacylase
MPQTATQPLPETTKAGDNAALALLAHLGIACRTRAHPPLHTVEESRALRGEIAGGHTKNLFLKDKAGSLFLVTAEEDSPLDLKAIDKIIGAKGRLSFATAEQLFAHLGILPGSVSPLALIHDRAARVRFVIERRLLAHAEINVHPLVNTLTSTVPRDGLLAYIRATGHEPEIHDLPHRAPAAG